MFGSNLDALLSQVGWVANIRRQIAQLASELNAGCNAHALAECKFLLRIGKQGDLSQSNGGFFGARSGVFVGGMISGNNRLAHDPIRFTAFYSQIGECDASRFHRACAKCPHGISNSFQVLRNREFFRIA